VFERLLAAARLPERAYEVGLGGRGVLGVAVDPQRLLVGADRLIVLFELGVGRALVHPRLLGLRRVLVGEAGGALERLRRLLEAVDPHVRQPHVDQPLDVDGVALDVALVHDVGEDAGVDGVDRVRVGVDPRGRG